MYAIVKRTPGAVFVLSVIGSMPGNGIENTRAKNAPSIPVKAAHHYKRSKKNVIKL